MAFQSQQEAFWAGEFGSEYIARNQGAELLASNLHLFAKILEKTRGVNSYIEFGANIGMNIQALKLLLPNAKPHAIEINADAVAELKKIVPEAQVFHESILEWQPQVQCDLALIKGVLIHINPDFLPQVYEKLAACAQKYLLVCEYYNPSPVKITYRGHEDRLFKRDFAGEILAAHPQFKLLDYGFVYRRDHNFPQDDSTWFLLEKR